MGDTYVFILSISFSSLWHDNDQTFWLGSYSLTPHSPAPETSPEWNWTGFFWFLFLILTIWNPGNHQNTENYYVGVVFYGRNIENNVRKALIITCSWTSYLKYWFRRLDALFCPVPPSSQVFCTSPPPPDHQNELGHR